MFVDGDVNVFPRPQRVGIDPNGGVFTVDGDTPVLAEAGQPGALRAARFLVGRLRRQSLTTGEAREHTGGHPPPGSILVTTYQADASLGPEGYELLVTPERARIRAPEEAGLLYGAQTLRQLLPAEIESGDPVSGVDWVVPSVEIVDRPRFPWRGFMLDVSRAFFPPEFVHRYIELLALHKINKLHLHLTDDQGWRIEIRSHPELHTLGSVWDPQRSPGELGGFYTQDELRDIVAHAAERNIEVIPEIDMPGHMVAALHALPELACTTSPDHVRTRDEFSITLWEQGPFIHEEVLCVCDQRVYSILEDVLDEVADIFPSKYVHLGGDEVPKAEWETSYLCQRLVEEENLQSMEHVQAYFTRRMEEILAARGKVLIGWDEILASEAAGDESTALSEAATVMHWRDFVQQLPQLYDRDVVQTPFLSLYLDYLSTPLEKTYDYEPVPDGLTPAQEAHILGAQGNMWTGFPHGRTQQAIDLHVFPKLLAIAELTWTPRELKDWPFFQQRLEDYTRRLDLLGVLSAPKTRAGTVPQRQAR